MYLQAAALIRLVKSVANTAGIRVSYHDDWKAYTDGKCIYIPTPNVLWDKETIEAWMCMVYHEIGHNAAPCNDWLGVSKRENLDHSSTLGILCNIIDDFRQEYIHSGKWRGRDDIVQKGRVKIIKDSVEEHKDAKTPSWFSATMAFSHKSREEFQPACIALRGILESKCDEKSKDFINKIESKGLHKEILDLETFEEVLEFSKKLLEIFEISEEDARNDGERAKSAAITEELERLFNQACEATGMTEEIRDAIKGLLVDSHADKGEDGEEISKPGGKGSDEGSGEYVMWDFEEIDLGKTRWGNSSPVRINVPVITSLASTMRRIIQIRSQQGHEGGHRSGKLNSKSFHRVLNGDDRVFRKPTERLTLDVSISILVDCSGSMHGNKWECAAAAATMMCSVLKSAQVPVEVLLFTDNADGYSINGQECIRGVLKKFGDSISDEELIRRFSDNPPGAGNLDGEAILWAYHRLQHQKTRRKILIVLSDGMPAGRAVSGNCRVFTKQVTAAIEETSTELYGIGICDSEVEHYYKDYVVINSPEELEDALISVIKAKLL